MNGPSLYSRIRQSLSRKGTRTYIFPTGFGLAFAAMALVLFFLAVGYANNLIYLFVFFLIAVAVTGTLVTNRNIEGLELEAIRADAFFAEEKSRIGVRLKNYKSLASWQLEAYFGKNPSSLAQRDCVRGLEEQELSVDFICAQRGWIPLPRLIVQSTFPFGLLRAWKLFKNTPSILVFPARRGDVIFPSESSSQDELKNSGLFRDHRPHQSSDSVMRVDWRASARRQQLLVKNFEELEKPTLRFQWSQTQHLQETEKRLSQLSLWIDQAERNGHQYSLELVNQKTSLDRGPAHWRRCLEMLAVFKVDA